MHKDTALYMGDDQRQRSLGRHLEPLGIELHKVSTLPAAEEMLRKESYSLVLIQYETIRQQIFNFYSFIHYEHPAAIIIVLMAKVQPKIEIKLFDSGVDDVAVGKQTFPSTLTSRIKRRFYCGKLPWPAEKKLILKGGVLINFFRREARVNGATRMIKSSVEKLLMYFLNNPDRVITREEMWESDIWDMSVARADREQEGKTFDMAIGRLRRAIEINPKSPQIIRTVHGKGWMLARDAVL